HPRYAACQRQEFRFSEKLANQSSPRRTERDTDSHLSRPFSRTGERQIGDVGACNEQHESHRGGKCNGGSRRLASGDEAQRRFRERRGLDRSSAIVLRISGFQARCNRLEAGQRPPLINAWLQAPEYVQQAKPALVEQLLEWTRKGLRVHADRQPY